MTSDTTTRVAREKYNQDDLCLSNSEWTELVDYVNEIELILDEYDYTPPRIIGGEEFAPGPWVGNYNDLVTISPKKITLDQYSTMVNDVEDLVQIFGGSMADAVLPLSPDAALDARTILPSYSRTLLSFTEDLLSGRLPIDVLRESERGYELRGPPDFRGIIKERASRSQMLVSKRTRFTFDTPANHLLHEFHLRMAIQLEDLIENFSHLPDRLSEQRQHHLRFIREHIPSEVKESSDTPEIEDPHVLTKMRQSSSGTMAEIVDLWEAYLNDRTTKLDPLSRFSTSIKPTYKVYELWCLHQILDLLGTEFGAWTPVDGTESDDILDEQSDRIIKKFTFEQDGITLFYDRSVSDMSKYVADDTAFGKTQSGRPDFLLTDGDDVRWLADAKFQEIERLGISGIQRFLGYIMDFIDLDGDDPPPVALLGVGPMDAMKAFPVEGVPVNIITMMSSDTKQEVGFEAIKDLIATD